MCTCTDQVYKKLIMLRVTNKNAEISSQLKSPILTPGPVCIPKIHMARPIYRQALREEKNVGHKNCIVFIMRCLFPLLNFL